MKLKRLPVACALSLVSAVPLSADDWHWVFRNRTRPACLSGIPAANYPYPALSPPVMAVSKSGVLLRKSTAVAEARLQALEEAVPPETTIRISPTDVERLPAPAASPVASPLVPPLVPLVARAPSGLFCPTIGECPRELRVPLPLLPKPRTASVVDLYQLDVAALTINHCSISQVALQLHSDGRWVLSLRADQNRLPPPEVPAPYNPFLHIKRNQFVVRLRCLGAAQTPPLAGDLAAGRPVLADLGPVSFWVENGQPLPVRTGDSSPWIQEHFEDIDRVEIEFFFR